MRSGKEHRPLKAPRVFGLLVNLGNTGTGVEVSKGPSETEVFCLNEEEGDDKKADS